MILSTLQLGVQNRGAVHRPVAAFLLNEDHRITQQGAPDTGPVPQLMPSGYLNPPLPPPHAWPNQRQPQPEQYPRPVIQPSVRDRVSNTKIVFNAGAKPFVGSLRSFASSAAPSKSKEARDMGSAASGSSSRSKLDCLLCGLYKGVCIARSMRLASVLKQKGRY